MQNECLRNKLEFLDYKNSSIQSKNSTIFPSFPIIYKNCKNNKFNNSFSLLNLSTSKNENLSKELIKKNQSYLNNQNLSLRANINKDSKYKIIKNIKNYNSLNKKSYITQSIQTMNDTRYAGINEIYNYNLNTQSNFNKNNNEILPLFYSNNYKNIIMNEVNSYSSPKYIKYKTLFKRNIFKNTQKLNNINNVKKKEILFKKLNGDYNYLNKKMNNVGYSSNKEISIKDDKFNCDIYNCSKNVNLVKAKIFHFPYAKSKVDNSFSKLLKLIRKKNIIPKINMSNK